MSRECLYMVESFYIRIFSTCLCGKISTLLSIPSYIISVKFTLGGHMASLLFTPSIAQLIRSRTGCICLTCFHSR